MSDHSRIIVNGDGYKTLGEKFIAWAKAGRKREPGEPVNAGWPTTLKQFTKDVGAVVVPAGGAQTGDEIQIPERLKSIQFVQSGLETLLIRLPPAELIRATEASFDDEDKYQLPEFYNEIYGNEPQDSSDLKDPKEIFKRRVGDYVIAHCK